LHVIQPAGIVDAMSEVTRILSAIEQGDPHAAEQLLPLVYDELRRLAADKLAHEKPGQTLEPTALVHEAYLRMVKPGAQSQWDNRGHFFAAAAEAMRRILVDVARHKSSLKCGGELIRHDLDDVQLAARELDNNVLAIDEALGKFATAEAAQLLGISDATAERYWTYARAWLHREITGTA
jgi:RNA polymerase sigma factor (TIGR02999 family)